MYLNKETSEWRKRTSIVFHAYRRQLVTSVEREANFVRYVRKAIQLELVKANPNWNTP